MRQSSEESSHGRTLARFDTTEAARKNAGRELSRRRDRECRCVLAALADVSRGGRLLDLPCGTGFLTTYLVDIGFEVVGADVSTHMLDRASLGWHRACAERPERYGKARFERQDILHTTFPDGHFNAVVCNRLFHHFCESATRRAALAELRRISRGPVVVFFFNRFALDTIRLAALRFVFGKFRRDRMTTSVQAFAAEAAEADLRLQNVLFTRWPVSPQCYAVFQPIATCPSSKPPSARITDTFRVDYPESQPAVQGPHTGKRSSRTRVPTGQNHY